MVNFVAKPGAPDVQIIKKGMAKGSTTEEYLGEYKP